MSINKGRFAAVVLAVGAIALGMTGAASAAPTPGHSIGEAWSSAAAVPAPIPNSQGSVTGYNIKDGTIYGADLGPGMINWFTTVYNGSVHEIGLDADLKAKVNRPIPAEVFGKTGGELKIDPTTIATIGGSWVTGKTELGSFTLPAGQYLINSAVVFDRLNADEDGYVVPTTDTMPQFGLRFDITDDNKFGVDAGTVMGVPVSKAGYTELTGSSTKAVTLTAETTITAYGFGYNEDRSGFGGGQVKVGGTVAAVRVG